MVELTSADRVACRTPNPGKPGQTRIPKWKFDVVRESILAELSNGPVPFGELTDLVRTNLPESARAELGSVGWHVTTVKLELEVRSEVRRYKSDGRQMLALAR